MRKETSLAERPVEPFRSFRLSLRTFSFDFKIQVCSGIYLHRSNRSWWYAENDEDHLKTCDAGGGTRNNSSTQS